MKNMLLVLIAACILGAAALCEAEDVTKSTAVFNQLWLKAIVSIEVLDAQGKGAPIGTGFLLRTPNSHLALVTAKHVVYENDGNGPLLKNLAYRLNRTNGTSILASDSFMDTGTQSGWFRSEPNDVACRLMMKEDISDYSTIPYARFLSTPQMQAGAPLFIIGFPLGLRSDQYATPIVRRASIARVDQDRVDQDILIVDGSVYPGNSGGPVVYEPVIQLGEGFTTGILQGEWLAGMVMSEIAYVEPAISLQTKRPRITFEQNSGLSNVLPADKVMELLRGPEFVGADETLTLIAPPSGDVRKQ
jgi:hypothetical protein